MSADANPLSSAELSTSVVAMAGVQLFERSSRGLRSTSAARVLYPEARAVLAALDRAEAMLREHQDAGAHALLLAASHTIGEFLLPEWLAAFRLEHPAARAQVEVVNSPGVLAALRAGEAQIGFVEGTDPLDGLESVVVRRDEVVAVVAAGHRWGRRARVRARELRSEPYLAREAASGTRAVATAALRDAGIELEPALEAASSQSLKRALAGGGFAFMSRLAVGAEVAAGSLHALEVADLDLQRDLLAVRDARRTAQSASDTAALWRFLRALPRAEGRAASGG